MCIGTEIATLSAHASERRVPRVDREVEAAHVVAPGQQAAGRGRDRERLVAELVGRDEEHLHVMTISMRRRRCPQRGFDGGRASSPRANRKPR